MRKRIAVVMAILLLFLNGCNVYITDEKKQSEESRKTAETDTFLEEAVYDFSYEKPKESPHILLNRNGYDQTDSKVAFIKGKELPEEFQVVDKKTKMIVFTGKIEKVSFDSESGEYFAQGDFSDLQIKGSYYLQAQFIGQSYSFEITEERFKTIYDNIIGSLYYHRCGTNLTGKIALNNHRVCHRADTCLEGTDTVIDTTGGWHTDYNFNKSVVESTKMMSDLMLTYEFLHGGGSTSMENRNQWDMDSMQLLLSEVYYEVPFLLKMQDEKTGAFYGGVRSSEELVAATPEDDQRKFYVTEISETATAECAGVLAQFSRIYKEIDAKTAEQCLDAATRGYLYLEKQQVQGEERYYAACQLYKTTGYVKYSQYVLQYLQDEEQWSGTSADAQGENRIKDSPVSISSNHLAADRTQKKGNSSQAIFSRKIYGDIAYLTTTYQVDMEVCSSLINQLMSRAQKVSASAREDAYLVYAPGGIRDSQTILEGAFLLAVIDHIVTSHEYVGVMENQLDYLFGRNEIGENLVTNKGVLKNVHEEEKYDLYLQSTLVFILHELIEREAE